MAHRAAAAAAAAATATAACSPVTATDRQRRLAVMKGVRSGPTELNCSELQFARTAANQLHDADARDQCRVIYLGQLVADHFSSVQFVRCEPPVTFRGIHTYERRVA